MDTISERLAFCRREVLRAEGVANLNAGTCSPIARSVLEAVGVWQEREARDPVETLFRAAPAALEAARTALAAHLGCDARDLLFMMRQTPDRGARMRRILPLCLALAAPAAFGRTVKGPSLSHEALLQEADVGPFDGDFEDEPPRNPDMELKKRRTELNVLAPIKAKVLGGMFVLKLDFFKEDRELTGPAAPAAQTNELKSPGSAGLGAIYLPHAKEGAPRFFVIGARYGYLDPTRKTLPMGEAIVGVDIADDDMPFSLKLNADDEAESRILVRYRRFPGFVRYLVLVGHKIETKSGFTIDVHVPSHGLFGWQTADAAWKVYGGFRGQSREYPFEADPDGTLRGWTEGYAATVLGGVRRHLRGILYVAAEAGGHWERLRYITAQGDELAAHQTKIAPWGRVALETWVTTP